MGDFSYTPVNFDIFSSHKFNLIDRAGPGATLTPTLTTQCLLLMPMGNKPFENTVGKGEIAPNEQFFLFPQCFLPIWIIFCHFLQI